MASVEASLARADPELGRVIEAVIARAGRQRITPSHATAFQALARAVVYQSISGASAAAIHHRLLAAVGKPLTPEALLAARPTVLREIGVSHGKAGAIRGLAEWFVGHPEAASALPTMTDREVADALKGVPGVGAWTINVFLIFGLGHPDVVPTVDLGIRRGVQLVCGLPSIATPKQVQTRAALWTPDRSLASIYLWTAVKLKLGPTDIGVEKLA